MSTVQYMAQRPDFEYLRERGTGWAISDKYQWLPTDFSFFVAIGEVTALSTLDSSCIQSSPASLPLFKRVLSDVLDPDISRAVEADPRGWYDHIEVPSPSDDEVMEHHSPWADLSP
ncbi:hypothetical protein C8T65DRAFT_744628 [Cerioporus squamosus]|nr:hypothetical protein C8T65DRAFT_744628 [Cerioporus squamosus]